MPKSYVEAPATHYRLNADTWAIIAEEYRNGASAKDVAAKWKVSASSVYRHACENGWTKKSHGDARARAHARMVEDEEAAVRSLQPVGSRALKSLFAPAPANDPDAGDAGALAAAALLASGRAMRGRLWAEAKALAGLAESYARVGEKRGVRALRVEDLDLKLLLEIQYDADEQIGRMFTIDPDRSDEDPDLAVKLDFWRRSQEGNALYQSRWREMMMRVYDAEAIAQGREPRQARPPWLDPEERAWVEAAGADQATAGAPQT